jgi:hypothetical protein
MKRKWALFIILLFLASVAAGINIVAQQSDEIIAANSAPPSNTLNTSNSNIMQLANPYQRWEDMVASFGGQQSFYLHDFATNHVWDGFTSFYNAQNTTLGLSNIRAISNDSTYQGVKTQTATEANVITSQSEVSLLLGSLSMYDDYLHAGNLASFGRWFQSTGIMYENGTHCVLNVTTCSDYYSTYMLFEGAVLKFHNVKFIYSGSDSQLPYTIGLCEAIAAQWRVCFTFFNDGTVKYLLYSGSSSSSATIATVTSGSVHDYMLAYVGDTFAFYIDSIMVANITDATFTNPNPHSAAYIWYDLQGYGATNPTNRLYIDSTSNGTCALNGTLHYNIRYISHPPVSTYSGNYISSTGSSSILWENKYGHSIFFDDFETYTNDAAWLATRNTQWNFLFEGGTTSEALTVSANSFSKTRCLELIDADGSDSFSLGFNSTASLPSSRYALLSVAVVGKTLGAFSIMIGNTTKHLTAGLRFGVDGYLYYYKQSTNTWLSLNIPWLVGALGVGRPWMRCGILIDRLTKTCSFYIDSYSGQTYLIPTTVTYATPYLRGFFLNSTKTGTCDVLIDCLSYSFLDNVTLTEAATYAATFEPNINRTLSLDEGIGAQWYVSPNSFINSSSDVSNEILNIHPFSGDYLGTYSFTHEPNGLFGLIDPAFNWDSDRNWSIVTGGWVNWGNPYTEIVPMIAGHSKVVHLSDLGSGVNPLAELGQFFYPRYNGTIECWIYTTDNFAQVYPENTGSYDGRVRFDTDYNIKVYDNNGGSPVYTTVGTYVLNQWYRVRFDFDAHAQLYNVSIGGVQVATNYMLRNTNPMDEFTFSSDAYGYLIYPYSVYFDAVDYSWSPNYYVERNTIIDPCSTGVSTLMLDSTNPWIAYLNFTTAAQLQVGISIAGVPSTLYNLTTQLIWSSGATLYIQNFTAISVNAFTRSLVPSQWDFFQTPPPSATLSYFQFILRGNATPLTFYIDYIRFNYLVPQSQCWAGGYAMSTTLQQGLNLRVDNTATLSIPSYSFDGLQWRTSPVAGKIEAALYMTGASSSIAAMHGTTELFSFTLNQSRFLYVTNGTPYRTTVPTAYNRWMQLILSWSYLSMKWKISLDGQSREFDLASASQLNAIQFSASANLYLDDIIVFNSFPQLANQNIAINGSSQSNPLSSEQDVYALERACYETYFDYPSRYTSANITIDSNQTVQLAGTYAPYFCFETNFNHTGNSFSQNVTISNNQTIQLNSTTSPAGNYLGLYSFVGDANGDPPAGWTSVGAVTVEASFLTHNKVLKIAGLGSCSYQLYTDGGQNTGTIEFWVAIDAADAGWSDWSVFGAQGAVMRLYYQNGYFYSPEYGNLAVCAPNTWYHIKMTWDATTWSFQRDSDTPISGIARGSYAAPTTSPCFNVPWFGSNAVFTIYVDALDYSWAAGYYLHRNMDQSGGGTTYSKNGGYQSPSYNLGSDQCYYQTLNFYKQSSGSDSIKVRYHTSADNITWNAWSAGTLVNVTINALHDRYFQFNLNLSSATQATTPMCYWVNLTYGIGSNDKLGYYQSKVYHLSPFLCIANSTVAKTIVNFNNTNYPINDYLSFTVPKAIIYNITLNCYSNITATDIRAYNFNSHTYDHFFNYSSTNYVLNLNYYNGSMCLFRFFSAVGINASVKIIYSVTLCWITSSYTYYYYTTLAFHKTVPAGTAVSLQYHTSADNLTWDAWSASSTSNQTLSLYALQYFQFRLNLTSNSISIPSCEWVNLSYKIIDNLTVAFPAISYGVISVRAYANQTGGVLQFGLGDATYDHVASVIMGADSHWYLYTSTGYAILPDFTYAQYGPLDTGVGFKKNTWYNVTFICVPKFGWSIFTSNYITAYVFINGTFIGLVALSAVEIHSFSQLKATVLSIDTTSFAFCLVNLTYSVCGIASFADFSLNTNSYYVSPIIDLGQPALVSRAFGEFPNLNAFYLQLSISNNTLFWESYEFTYDEVSNVYSGQSYFGSYIARFVRFTLVFFSTTLDIYYVPHNSTASSFHSVLFDSYTNLYAFTDATFERQFNHTQAQISCSYVGEPITTVLQDTFDTYTTLPAYWVTAIPSQTAITLSTGKYISSPYSLHLYDNNPAATCSVYSTFDPISTYCYVSVEVCANQLNGYLAINFQNSSGTTIVSLLMGNGDSHWYVGDSGSYTDTGFTPFTAGTWYTLSFYLNLAEHFWYFKINGATVLSSINFMVPTANLGTLTQFVDRVKFVTADSAGFEPFEYYIDNCLVQRMFASSEVLRSTINSIIANAAITCSSSKFISSIHCYVYWWTNSTWIAIPSTWTDADVFAYFPSYRYDGLMRFKISLANVTSALPISFTLSQNTTLSYLAFRQSYNKSDLIEQANCWTDYFEGYGGGTPFPSGNYTLVVTGGSAQINTTFYHGGAQGVELKDTSVSNLVSMSLEKELYGTVALSLWVYPEAAAALETKYELIGALGAYCGVWFKSDGTIWITRSTTWTYSGLFWTAYAWQHLQMQMDMIHNKGTVALDSSTSSVVMQWAVRQSAVADSFLITTTSTTQGAVVVDDFSIQSTAQGTDYLGKTSAFYLHYWQENVNKVVSPPVVGHNNTLWFGSNAVITTWNQTSFYPTSLVKTQTSPPVYFGKYDQSSEFTSWTNGQSPYNFGTFTNTNFVTGWTIATQNNIITNAAAKTFTGNTANSPSYLFQASFYAPADYYSYVHCRVTFGLRMYYSDNSWDTVFEFTVTPGSSAYSVTNTYSGSWSLGKSFSALEMYVQATGAYYSASPSKGASMSIIKEYYYGGIAEQNTFSNVNLNDAVSYITSSIDCRSNTRFTLDFAFDVSSRCKPNQMNLFYDFSATYSGTRSASLSFFQWGSSAPTFQTPVAADSDDAGYTFSGSPPWTQSGTIAGQFSGYKRDSFLCFPLNVPVGSTITTGTLNLYLLSTVGAPALKIYLINLDDCMTFPPDGSTSDESAYPVTTTHAILWSPSGTGWKSIDIKQLIQDFVARPSYREGNYIGIKIDNNNLANGNYIAIQPKEATTYTAYLGLSISYTSGRWIPITSFQNRIVGNYSIASTYISSSGAFKLRLSSGYTVSTTYSSQLLINYLRVDDNIGVWQDSATNARSLHTELRFNTTLTAVSTLTQSLHHIHIDWGIQYSKPTSVVPFVYGYLWNYHTSAWVEIWRWTTTSSKFCGFFATDSYFNDFTGRDFVASNGTVRFQLAAYPEQSAYFSYIDYAYVEVGLFSGTAENFLAFSPDATGFASSTRDLVADDYLPLTFNDSYALAFDNQLLTAWVGKAATTPELNFTFHFTLPSLPFAGLQLSNFGFPDTLGGQSGTWGDGYVQLWNYATSNWNTVLTVPARYAPYLRNYTIPVNVITSGSYVNYDMTVIARLVAAQRAITSGLYSYQANIALDAIHALSDGSQARAAAFKFSSSSESYSTTIVQTGNNTLSLFRSTTQLFFQCVGNAVIYELVPNTYYAYLNVTLYNAVTHAYLGQWSTKPVSPSKSNYLFDVSALTLRTYASQIMYNVKLIIESHGSSVRIDLYAMSFEFGTLVQPDEISLRINGIRPTPTGLGTATLIHQFSQRSLNITSSYPSRLDISISGVFSSTTHPPELYDSRTLHYYIQAPFTIEYPIFTLYNFTCSLAYARSGTSAWTLVSPTVFSTLTSAHCLNLPSSALVSVLTTANALNTSEYLDLILLTSSDIYARLDGPRIQTTPSTSTATNVTINRLLTPAVNWQYYYFIEPSNLTNLNIIRLATHTTISPVSQYHQYYYFDSYTSSSSEFIGLESFNATYDIAPWFVYITILLQNSTYLSLRCTASAFYGLANVSIQFPLPTTYPSYLIWRMFEGVTNLTATSGIHQVGSNVLFFLPSLNTTSRTFSVTAYRVAYTVQLKAGQTSTYVQYQIDALTAIPSLFHNTVIRINTTTDTYLVWKIYENFVQQLWNIDTSFATYLLITIPNFTASQRTFYLQGYAWLYSQATVISGTYYAHYRLTVRTNDIDAINAVGGGVLRVNILNVLDYTVWTVTSLHCTYHFNTSSDLYADHININLTNVQQTTTFLEVEGYRFGFESAFISQSALKIYYTNTLTLPTNASMTNHTTIYTVIPNAVNYGYWTLTAPTLIGGECYLSNHSGWTFTIYADRVEITIPSIKSCIALNLISSFPNFITFKIIGYNFVVNAPVLASSSSTLLAYNVKVSTDSLQALHSNTLITVEIDRTPQWSVVELYLNNVNVTSQFTFQVNDLHYVQWIINKLNQTDTIFQVRVYTWAITQLKVQDTDLLAQFSITISVGHPRVVVNTTMTIDISAINPVPFRIWELWYGSQNLTAWAHVQPFADRILLTIPNFTISSRGYTLYGYGHSVTITQTQSIDLEEIYAVKVSTLHNRAVVNEQITVSIPNLASYPYWEVTLQNQTIVFSRTTGSILFLISNMTAGDRTYSVHGYAWRSYSYLFNSIPQHAIYKIEISVLHTLNLTGVSRDVGVNIENYYAYITWALILGNQSLSIAHFDASHIFFTLPIYLNDTVSGVSPDYIFILTGYAYNVEQVLLTNNELLEQYRVTVTYDHDLLFIPSQWNTLTAYILPKSSTLKWYWEVISNNLTLPQTLAPIDQIKWNVVNLTGTTTTFIVSGYGARITPATSADDPNAFIEETGSLIVYRVTVEVLKLQALNATLIHQSSRFIDIRFSSTNIAMFPTWRLYANSYQLAYILNYSTTIQQQFNLASGFNFTMSNTLYSFYIPYVNSTSTTFDLIGYRNEIQLHLTPLQSLSFQFEITVTTSDLSTLETLLRVTQDTRDGQTTKISDVQHALYWELWWNGTIVSDSFLLQVYPTYAEFHPHNLNLAAYQGQYSTVFYLFAYKLDYDHRFTLLNQTYMTYQLVIRTPNINTVNHPFKYQPCLSLPQYITDPDLASGHTIILTASGLIIQVEDAEHSFSQMTLWQFDLVSPFFANYSAWMTYGAEVMTVTIPYLNTTGDNTYELRGYKFYVTYTLLNQTPQIGQVRIAIQSQWSFPIYHISKELIFGENNQFNFTDQYRLYSLYFSNTTKIADLSSSTLLHLNQFVYDFPSAGGYLLEGYNWLVLSTLLWRNATYMQTQLTILSIHSFPNYTIVQPLVFDSINVGNYLLYSTYFSNNTMREFNITINRAANLFAASLPTKGIYYLCGYSWAHARTFMNVNNATYNQIDITLESLLEFGSYYWIQDPYAPNSNVSIAAYREYELWAPNIRVLILTTAQLNSTQYVTIFSGDVLLFVYNVSSTALWYQLFANGAIIQQGRYYKQFVYTYANPTTSTLYNMTYGASFIKVNVTVLDHWTFLINTQPGFLSQTNSTYLNQPFTLQWLLHGTGYYRVFRNGTLIISSTAFSDGETAVWTSFSEPSATATYAYDFEIDYGAGFVTNHTLSVSIASKPDKVLYKNSLNFYKRVDNTFAILLPYQGTWSLRSYDWILDKVMYVQRADYFRLDFQIIACHDFLRTPFYDFSQPLQFDLTRLQGTVHYDIAGYLTYTISNHSSYMSSLTVLGSAIYIRVTDRTGYYSICGFSWSYSYQIVDYDIGRYLELRLTVSANISLGNMYFDLDLSSQLVTIDYWQIAFWNNNTPILNTGIHRLGYHILFNFSVFESQDYRIRGYGIFAAITLNTIYFNNATHFGARLIVNAVNQSAPMDIVLNLAPFLTRSHEFWGITINGIKWTNITVTSLGSSLYQFTLPHTYPSNTYAIYGLSDYWVVEYQGTSIVQISYVVNTFNGVNASVRYIDLNRAGSINAPVWELYFRDNGTKYKDIIDFSSAYLRFNVTISSHNAHSFFPQGRYTIYGRTFAAYATVIEDSGVYTNITYHIVTSFPIVGATIILDLNSLGIDHELKMSHWTVSTANGTFYVNATEYALNRIRFVLSQSVISQTWIVQGFAPVPFASIYDYAAEGHYYVIINDTMTIRGYLSFPKTSRYWFVVVDPSWECYYIKYGNLTYDIQQINASLLYFEGWANPSVATAYLSFLTRPIINETERFIDSTTYYITITTSIPLDGLVLITDDLGLNDRRIIYLVNSSIGLLKILDNKVYYLHDINLVAGENIIILKADIPSASQMYGGLSIVVAIIGIVVIGFWWWRRRRKKSETPKGNKPGASKQFLSAIGKNINPSKLYNSVKSGARSVGNKLGLKSDKNKKKLKEKKKETRKKEKEKE